MEKAVTIDEILGVQKAINDLTMEIESMEGRLVTWDKQVGECTVTISFSQTDTSLGFFQGLMIFLLVVVSIVLIVLAVIYVIRLMTKKSKQA
jgi:hypothetical protein